MGIGIIVVVLIGIMAIVLLSGHGGFLIAGYNTASKEEKAMYDEKKLCRITGIGFLVMEIGLIGLIFLKNLNAFSIFSLILIFIGIAIPLLFGNKYARKKGVSFYNDKRNKRLNIINIIFTGIILVSIGIVMFVGNISVEFHKNDVKCSGFLAGSTTVSYDEIESVSLEKDLDLGTRTFGIGSFSINAGNFSNDEFGTYKLYAYTSCNTYVVIDTGEKVVVVNDKDEKDTTSLYHEFLKYVEDKWIWTWVLSC